MLTMNAEQMRECLTDAGCAETLIGQFEALWFSDRQKDRLRLLNDYRHQLLERIHAEQKKLDCLDYLIYAVKSNASV